MSWVIEMNAGEPIPAYYSLRAAKMVAGASAWSHAIHEALQFARKEDADLYVKRYLPNSDYKVMQA